MICDDCKHVIFRTYRNGPTEEYHKWSCDIDGKENPPQLHACGRKEEVPKPEPVVEFKPLEPVTSKAIEKYGFPIGNKRVGKKNAK
jgi:hypothetical protein